MRASATRIGVLDSVASARRGAGDCMSALHLSGSVLRVGGAVLGGMLLARVLLRSRKVAAVAPVAVKAPSPWTGLAVKVVAMLLLPLLQSYLTGERKLPALQMPQVRLPQMKMPVLDLTYLFYRWLGLVK